MNSVQLTPVAIATIVVTRVLFAGIDLAKLYDPSTEVRVSVQLVLTMALSTVLTAAWMVGDTVQSTSE